VYLRNTLRIRRAVGTVSAVSVICLILSHFGCSGYDGFLGNTGGAGLNVSSTVGRHIKGVSESARDIIVTHDVDVIVVGGTSGGVAAAVAAANSGAKVFLAAERNYLGEDICGTYRLWLDGGDEPRSSLAKSVFEEPAWVRGLGDRVAFKYDSDKESENPHRDTQPASLLSDGKWHSAVSQSVQYSGNVTIVAELAQEYHVRSVHVMVYQRNSDFEVESVAISVSRDGQSWQQVGVIKNDRLSQGSFEESAVELGGKVGEQARFVKLLVRQAPGAKRILLGEILIESGDYDVTHARAARVPPTPMQVKRVLDGALLDAGVEFLFGCYVTDVLWDENSRIAGIVMANRSGRQAVRAKVIVDATPRATVARLAGVSFSRYPVGLQSFKRIVVGGKIREGQGISSRQLPEPILAADGRRYEAIEYTLQIPMKDGSFTSFAKAEQAARDMTWHKGQVDCSEALFQVPLDNVEARATLHGRWFESMKVDLNVFRPAGTERLYVLGGCADVSREIAGKMLQPVELMEVGERVGAMAAVEARSITKAEVALVRGRSGTTVAAGDVRHDSSYTHLHQVRKDVIHCQGRVVPVLGQYDVVIVGGGTAGAPAGIAAARQGAKTLVVEYLYDLGGVGTVGLINKYYHGNICGFTREVDEGVARIGNDGNSKGAEWNIQWKIEWYRQELRKAGADIWFGALGCGAFVDGACVKGVVVATPEGCGVVLAKAVIDSTGNADIAAAAGAQCVYTNGTGVAVQGAGLPPRKIDAGYTNTDWTFIDDADVVDVWRAFVVARTKYKNAYDLGQLVDTRERRRIVGDFIMSPMDISNNRTYPDTVVIAGSDFDSHGFTVHPVFLLKAPDRRERLANVPYRCLLPRGVDGILVTGLGVSADRDAIPVIRMQADVQNQGYAAGVAAAMAAKSGRVVREIDIKALQRHLVEKGSLPQRVLSDEDSYPLSKESVQRAVKSLVNDFEGLEVVLAQVEEAMPLLKEAYQNADSDRDKLTYGHILGMLGDASGIETLLAAVKSRQWDKGWNFTGMGQYGASLSPLDSLIIALGRTRDKRALTVIIEKVGRLDANSEFSHCRAVAMAIEALADPAAGQSLAELLKKPGMAGHAFTDIKKAQSLTPESSSDTSTRNDSLRELFLAAALYKCGDYEGLGEKVLREYALDLHGHYARHAQAVLKEKINP